MKCYIVSFETSSEDATKALEMRLKSYPNYCPINKYCWAIMTEQSAAQIREHLSGALNFKTDHLFVILSGTESSWYTYGAKNSEWLKKNL